MYQNVPMQTIQLLIFTRVLRCHDILEDDQGLYTLCLSMVTTIFKVIQNLRAARKDAIAHRENCLEHLMQSMTALDDWIPFVHMVNDDNQWFKIVE